MTNNKDKSKAFFLLQQRFEKSSHSRLVPFFRCVCFLVFSRCYNLHNITHKQIIFFVFTHLLTHTHQHATFAFVQGHGWGTNYEGYSYVQKGEHVFFPSWCGHATQHVDVAYKSVIYGLLSPMEQISIAGDSWWKDRMTDCWNSWETLRELPKLRFLCSYAMTWFVSFFPIEAGLTTSVTLVDYNRLLGLLSPYSPQGKKKGMSIIHMHA